jgi:hypothetical protein
MKTFTLFAQIPLALVALGACSSTPDLKPSGFLGNGYADMQVDPDTGNLTYRKDGADLGAYSKVMLDRVEVWVDTEDRYKGASWMDVRRCAEIFGEAMRQALADGYPVVDAPGPDVLRIRLAVTGVQADVEGYATRANLGYGDPDTVDMISTTGTELDIETISIEADFLDSATEERLFAAVVQRSSKATKGETSWQAVEESFADLARRVRAGLDGARSPR